MQQPFELHEGNSTKKLLQITEPTPKTVSLRSPLRYPTHFTASCGARPTPAASVTVWSVSPAATGRNRTRPAHSAVRSPAPPAPGRAPRLEGPALHRWHCRHNPPVEPVRRAEGDQAGHSRLAATARGPSTHRLRVPRAESPPPPLAPGRVLGWTKTLSAAAQGKLRRPGSALRFTLRLGSLCRPGGGNQRPLLSGSRDSKFG